MAEACDRPNRQVWQEREYSICLHSELGSSRIEVPGTSCLRSLARGCGSTTLPSLTSGGDTAAKGAVLPFVQSWSSVETGLSCLQCCPVFLGLWCGKITQPPVALALSSAVTTMVLPLLLLVIFFLYTELPRLLLLK